MAEPKKNPAQSNKVQRAKQAAHDKASPPPAVLLAVVRARGLSGLHPKRKRTMEMLGLYYSNAGTLVPSTPSYMGMLREAKDYLAWGPLSEKMAIAMLAKRGTMEGRKLSLVKKPEEIAALARLLMSGKTPASLGMDHCFRLTPPSGGWKDKKKTYPYGDLGARPSMDSLIKSMI